MAELARKARLLIVVLLATLVVVVVVVVLMPDSEANGALNRLRTLRVASESRCSPYSRADYGSASASEQRIVDRMGGRIYGPYSGKHFPTMRDTEVEHIVALSEAHDSGLCSASPTLRRSFGTDLDNLTLASPQQNRTKSARDAAEWVPPLTANRCWFAARVVSVRDKHRLTIDPVERDTLETILKGCTDTAMVILKAMDG